MEKNLGHATAYGYAKSKGYSGTEDEFAELMASYADVAQRAGESAQTASEKAQQASASAESASQSASSASASATSAQASATTATAKASEAQQGAQTATTKAQEASQSASTASQSASTAVQAKQGAESAKTASETAQASAETARDDAESARDTAQQYAESINPEKLIGAYPTDTASGAIASFTDGADNIPMKKVTVRIEPKQDLHGQDTPYPAGGGKNLFDGSTVSTSAPNNWGVSFANDALTITHKNENTIGVPQISPNFPAGTYVLSFASQTKTASISLYVDGSYNTIMRSGDTFTVADGHAYAITFSADIGTPNIITKIQIEKGTTPSAYAPYSNVCPISGWDSVQVSHSGADRTNPTTKTISLPQTVYGGTLDVTKGELVVDRAMVTLDGSRNYSWNSNNNLVTTSIQNGIITNAITQYNSYTLNSTFADEPWAGRASKDGTLGMFYGDSALYVKFSETTSADAAKAFFADNPTTVVYKLATPIHYPLTPTEIKTLLGQNNIWSDTGDTEVEYRANTKLYINKKIAEALASLT